MGKDIQRLKDISKEISQNIQTIQEQTANYQASAKPQAQLKVQQLYLDFEKDQELIKEKMKREIAVEKEMSRAEIEQGKNKLKAIFDKNIKTAVSVLIEEVIASGHR